MRGKLYVIGCLCAFMGLDQGAAASNRTGEAVVAALTGQVEARYFIGSVHDGRTEKVAVFEGASVGERTQLTTGRNGHCCLVFTPGVLLHMAPDTVLRVEEVRLMAPGLPRSEDDLIRRVIIHVERGRVYINAGVPSPSLQLVVETDAGRIEANGGQFSMVSTDRGWSILLEEYEADVAPAKGARRTLMAGDRALLSETDVSPTDTTDERLHRFELCRGLFRDIEPFFHSARGYDRDGVGRYLGLSGPPIYLGAQGLIADVSPSFRPTPAAATAPAVPRLTGPAAGKRWSNEQIWRWWESVGVIRGVNYIQSTAVNSTEMWMEETFDPDRIDEELAYAKASGYTAVRVILQQAVWQTDPKGFLDRLDQFLDVAAGQGLTVVPVLFDDLNRAGRDPVVGPQEEPVPGRHNARWTPGPGPSAVTDLSRWPALEKYAQDVVGRFKRDKRVLYWDVYNTAGNDGLWDRSLPLMDAAVEWVRAVNPRQPVAVPAWRDLGSPMSARKLEISDLLTFHTFENAEVVEAQIRMLQRHRRPLVVSDWLLRQRGSTFEEILPVLAAHGVGWFNRGLVQGRTQMWIQEEGHRNEEEPNMWQHDVLTPDGDPYNEDEIKLIRGFRYAGER